MKLPTHPLHHIHSQQEHHIWAKFWTSFYGDKIALFLAESLDILSFSENAASNDSCFVSMHLACLSATVCWMKIIMFIIVTNLCELKVYSLSSLTVDWSVPLTLWRWSADCFI